MLANVIKLGVLAGVGYAAWKAFARQQSHSFFKQALQAGAADVEAARSAELRGAAAGVRGFAQQLEREHAHQNLQLAEASGLKIPPPDARQRGTLHQLDLQQGEAYDRAWLRHMAQSHHTAIQLYQHEVDKAGPGAELAAEALPQLRANARRVAELQLGEGPASSGGQREPVPGEGMHA